MIKVGIRTLIAVIAGLIVAVALVVAVELFSAIVHPAPAGFDGNIAEHVKRYPHWVLAVVVLAWGGTSASATWVASRIGNRVAGSIVAVVLVSALIFNLTMLPYTMWFKVVMPCALLVGCLLGIRYGKRGRAAELVKNAGKAED